MVNLYLNRWLCTLLLCVLANFMLQSQDTLTVQTFDWSSNTRSDVFEFPDDPNASYAKILMTYNMRCHDNQVGNGNVGCREWDYSCNTFITDSSRTDSLMRSHPSHLISNFAGNVFEYHSNPIYAYTQFDRVNVVLDTAYHLDTSKTLNDNNVVEVLNSNQAAYQYILTSDELIASGLQPGQILGMEMPFELGDFFSMSFRINLMETNRETLTPSTPITGAWEEVYFNELTINQSGMNSFYFHTPFEWDGSSNLAVEILFNDKMTPTNERFLGQKGDGKAILVNREDHVFALNGAQYFEPDPRDFRELNNEITVMAWLYGDPDALPTNTYLIEGVDANNQRQLNVHLPWGNGEVFFDCGNDGSGYDRISKAALPEDYSGQWNHWAFTKNATTGSMKIYLNGTLWQSGSGKSKAMDIERLVVGKGASVNNGWAGWINELSVWQSELDRDQIYEAMMAPVDSHDLYDEVLLYFNFEEERGRKVTNVKNNQDYNIIGSPFWRKLRAEDLFFGYEAISARPSASFYQGDIEVSYVNNPYLDSAMVPPHWVRPFHIENNRDVVEETSMYLWRAGDYYTYNDQGQVVDTLTYSKDGEISISDLTYFQHRPSKFEILSLVTPYGNGLSLGSEGVTFTFDVTDFAPILKGKKRMSIEMGGEWQEELDIQFHFIEGTPAREVLDIQNIWSFQRGNYGDIQADNVFEPRTVNLHPDADYYKIRSSITGHGQNGEFQSRNHYLNLDGGAQDFEFTVWKECSTIPIFPQGGTWVFDRAGWCPGDPTLLFEHDITNMVNPGGQVEIDYGVNGPHMDQANYLVSHQLVSYGEFNRTVDAAIEHIIRPSQNVEWARENPACNSPTIVIKNYGTEILTSATIQYGVRNGIMESFDWTGDLGFGEQETVVLPVVADNFWSAAANGPSVFVAQVVNVNGGASDGESNNDIMKSEFELPQILPGPLQLEILTNSVGSETSYKILDQAGSVLFEGDGLASNSKTVVDLDLSPGCYTLEVNDSGDDGLYYWYWEQTGQSRGRGHVRFNRLFNGRPIGVKSFDSEFGRYIHYDFGVGSITSNEEQKVLQHLTVQPNPSQGLFNIQFLSEATKTLDVTITDALGRPVYSNQFRAHSGESLNEWIDLQNQNNGMYFMTFTQDDRTTTRTVILSK